MRTGITISILGAGMALGAIGTRLVESKAIQSAQRAEWQSQGLESECKSTLKGREFENRMDEQANGDYRLSVYGGRRMVCEKKDVRITQQPDAEEPMVVECSHRGER